MFYIEVDLCIFHSCKKIWEINFSCHSSVEKKLFSQSPSSNATERTNIDMKTWQLPLKDETISIEIAHKQAEEKRDTMGHIRNAKRVFPQVTQNAYPLLPMNSGWICLILVRLCLSFLDSLPKWFAKKSYIILKFNS